MQMIEGPEEAVQSLLMKIYSDPRHRGVLELIEGYTDERQFSEWAMGLKELDSAETKADPGYSEFLNTPLTSVEFRLNPSRCQRLLLIFKESRS